MKKTVSFVAGMKRCAERMRFGLRFVSACVGKPAVAFAETNTSKEVERSVAAPAAEARREAEGIAAPAAPTLAALIPAQEEAGEASSAAEMEVSTGANISDSTG